MKKILEISLIILAIVLFPGFSGFLILMSAFFTKGKKAYYLLLLSCLLICLIFLDLIPGSGLDFDRYMQMTSALRYMHIQHFSDLLNFFQSSAENEQNNYLFIFIQYIASKFKFANLLSCISVALSSFFCMFPFIDLVQKKNRYKIFSLILSLIAYFILGYGYMASVMRWSLAVTSSVFIDYLYFIKLQNNKKWCFILIIPMFFHTGIILAVLMSFFVAFTKRITIVDIVIFSLCCSIFLFLSGNGSSSSGLMGQVVNTTKIYSTNFLAAGETRNAAILNWIMYFVYFMLIMIDGMIHKLYKNYHNYLTSLAVLCIVATILLATRYLILIRFISLACLFLALDILITLNNIPKMILKFSQGMGLLVSIITGGTFVLAAFCGFVSFRQFAFPGSIFEIWFRSFYYLVSNALLF